MGIIKIIGFLLFIISFTILFLALLPKKEATALKDRMDTKQIPSEQMSEGGKFIRIFKPFIILLLPLIDLLPLTSYFQKIKRYLIHSGMESDVSEKEFVGFQIVIAILFWGMAMLFFDNMIMKIGALLLGVVYPYIWLVEKKKKRQEAIRICMPDIVDTLSLSVEAGLDFFNAANQVIGIFMKKENNPLAFELDRMLKNIRLGMTRQEALKTMAERIDIMEIHSFVTTLTQSEKMGTSISAVLKDQAKRMREERFMRAEQVGAMASQKLLVPTVFLIFPVVFMIIFAPILLQYLFR